MDAALAEPVPMEPGLLSNFEARMMRSFRAAIEDWDEVCSALGAWEARRLTEDRPGSAKDQHWRCVTELLLWGRLVQSATRHPDFPDKQLAARVGHLQDKLALWHGQMTPREEERILHAAFA